MQYLVLEDFISSKKNHHLQGINEIFAILTLENSMKRSFIKLTGKSFVRLILIIPTFLGKISMILLNSSWMNMPPIGNSPTKNLN